MKQADGNRPFTRIDAQNAMPLAFPAFLGRFGALTGIQAAAFRHVLAGSDVMIIAPAASGKTEAAMAPLCQRMSAGKPEGAVGILYIVPTKALANDIESRIREPAGAMKMTCRIRTGDHPTPVGTRRADILVTTPESLDSLLCRAPGAFDHLHALVVDEAHLVDSTARGDQLRILIRRILMKKAASRPQLVAMSATVGDPEGLGERLFGAVPVIVRNDGVRGIDSTTVASLADALSTMRAGGLTKAIIFCNTRRMAEQTAAEAAKAGPWPAERVMVHHASLPAREREETESAFRYWEAGLLVSTSTMELGVDIGNVDAVILADPPDSVASLYQRVGRGCRRREGMKAIFVAPDAAARAAFEELMKDVRDHTMPVKPYRPDLSVVVQQIFSLLFENRRGLSRRTLRRLLEVLADGPTVDIIIDHLRSGGYLLEGSSEVLRASPRLMDMGETGRIHSNIADTKSVRVVDAATGKTVGLVSRRSSEGQSVTIGGRSWTVTGSSSGGVAVRASAAPASESTARFGRSGDGGAFTRFLPDELRAPS